MKSEHNVFVVDDNASARNGITRLLKVAGYNVRSYASASELININSEIRGCIVLDARMPEISYSFIYN